MGIGRWIVHHRRRPGAVQGQQFRTSRLGTGGDPERRFGLQWTIGVEAAVTPSLYRLAAVMRSSTPSGPATVETGAGGFQMARTASWPAMFTDSALRRTSPWEGITTRPR